MQCSGLNKKICFNLKQNLSKFYFWSNQTLFGIFGYWPEKTRICWYTNVKDTTFLVPTSQSWPKRKLKYEDEKGHAEEEEEEGLTEAACRIYFLKTEGQGDKKA